MLEALHKQQQQQPVQHERPGKALVHPGLMGGSGIMGGPPRCAWGVEREVGVKMEKEVCEDGKGGV
jgi:hypothetical protein